ncbi:hypothetical protein ACN9S2_20060 [Pseudomonas aeruginosa]
MNKANECTCPSGDASLVHPCPAHPAVEQVGGDERAAFEAAFAAMGRPVCRADYDQDAYGTPFDDGGWTGWQARAALAQPSPVRSSLLINGYQLRAALDFIAPDGTAEQLKSEACIEWRQQDADFLEAGLYAFCAEYPEEGGVLLDEEPTTAQPSPLQSDQAEAERPEVVAYLFVKPDGTLSMDAVRHKPSQPAVAVMTVAQHERIVGELRAENAEWQEAAGRSRSDVVAYIAERAKLLEERAAALVEVERLRESKGDPVGSLEKCMKVMYERDEHAKQLEAALARVAELERQEPVALANRGLHAFWVKWTEAAAGLYGPGIKLYAAPVAQAQQLNDLDKQCRDDVARALGLRPNQERGFAWSYLLASIKSCVKASGDSAQAQHSVPDGAADLCRFLAKLYCELDGLRYSTAKLPAEQIADALIFKWPVLQGARNQLNIKRISEQPYDESKLHSAIAAMLAAAPGKEVGHE